MGNRKKEETYKQSKELGEQARTAYNPLITQAGERAESYNPGIGGQKDYLTSQYKGMLETGPSRVSLGGGVSSPGKVDVSDLRNTLPEYQKFRDTGGLSAENIERMRGMGGFEEFAKTGGYTAPQLANIKAQAISPIGSFATGTRDELARRRSVQGGYAPGFDAANRQLQRDTSRAIADTSLNANIALQDRINQGRQWGIGGLSAAESGLAGMQTGNRLAALGGETNIGSAISNASAADISNAMAADQINAQIAAQEAMVNAGREDAYRSQGLSGLSDIYGTDVGLQQGEYDRQGRLLGDMSQASQGFLSNQTQAATMPSGWDRAINAAGTAAGIGASLMAPGAAQAGLGGIYQLPKSPQMLRPY